MGKFIDQEETIQTRITASYSFSGKNWESSLHITTKQAITGKTTDLSGSVNYDQLYASLTKTPHEVSRKRSKLSIMLASKN